MRNERFGMTISFSSLALEKSKLQKWICFALFAVKNICLGTVFFFFFVEKVRELLSNKFKSYFSFYIINDILFGFVLLICLFCFSIDLLDKVNQQSTSNDWNLVRTSRRIKNKAF